MVLNHSFVLRRPEPSQRKAAALTCVPPRTQRRLPRCDGVSQLKLVTFTLMFCHPNAAGLRQMEAQSGGPWAVGELSFPVPCSRAAAVPRPEGQPVGTLSRCPQDSTHPPTESVVAGLPPHSPLCPDGSLQHPGQTCIPPGNRTVRPGVAAGPGTPAPALSSSQVPERARSLPWPEGLPQHTHQSRGLPRSGTGAWLGKCADQQLVFTQLAPVVGTAAFPVLVRP